MKWNEMEVHTTCSMYDQSSVCRARPFPFVQHGKHEQPLCVLICCNGKQCWLRAAVCCRPSEANLVWKWMHLICHHIPTYPLIHAVVTVQWAAGKMNTYLCLWKCSHCRLSGHTPGTLQVSQSWGCWEKVGLYNDIILKAARWWGFLH